MIRDVTAAFGPPRRGTCPQEASGGNLPLAFPPQGSGFISWCGVLPYTNTPNIVCLGARGGCWWRARVLMRPSLWFLWTWRQPVGPVKVTGSHRGSRGTESCPVGVSRPEVPGQAGGVSHCSSGAAAVASLPHLHPLHSIPKRHFQASRASSKHHIHSGLQGAQRVLREHCSIPSPVGRSQRFVLLRTSREIS